MFRSAVAAVCAAILVLGSTLSAEARSRQVKMGASPLEAGGSSATIEVSSAKGAFNGIRIRAAKGPIAFTGVRIVYSDDSFHLIEKNFQLKTGEQTKILDQGKDDKFVDRVIVSYQGADSPMEVEAFGIQSRNGARKQRPKPAAVAAPSPSAAPAAPPAGGVAAAPVPPPPKPKPIIADPATIAEGRDVMFGYQTVGFGVEREKITISPDTGKFHAIRLKVRGSDIHIKELAISYADGSSETLTIDAAVKAEQKTKWFKVNDKAFIKEIELAYKPRPGFKGQARVEVVGQFSDGWLAAGGEGRQFNDGWVLLGSQTAGAIGFDKDVVTIGKNEGGFKKIRLKVRDRSITLREIRVAYLEGPDDVIKTNDRVDPDQIAGPWDLKPGQPAIKEIVAVYRRRMIFGKGQGTAVVEFWGQH